MMEMPAKPLNPALPVEPFKSTDPKLACLYWQRALASKAA
jgi:hypothetical protein